VGQVLATKYPGCYGAQDLKSASDAIVMGTSAETAVMIGYIDCFPLCVYGVQCQALAKPLFSAYQVRNLLPKFKKGLEPAGPDNSGWSHCGYLTICSKAP
jgi:hypothetical protein